MNLKENKRDYKARNKKNNDFSQFEQYRKILN